MGKLQYPCLYLFGEFVVNVPEDSMQKMLKNNLNIVLSICILHEDEQMCNWEILDGDNDIVSFGFYPYVECTLPS